MPFIKNIYDRHHLHSIAVTVFCVHIVLYGDKPYPERREHIIHVLPDLDIVSAKAGKIFYDNGIDDSRFGVVQQPLPIRSVERRSRYAVVYVFVVDLETVFFGIFAEH